MQWIFAVEHWFSCRTTEPGFAGHIDAIEVWLIDWSIAWFENDDDDADEETTTQGNDYNEDCDGRSIITCQVYNESMEDMNMQGRYEPLLDTSSKQATKKILKDYSVEVERSMHERFVHIARSIINVFEVILL